MHRRHPSDHNARHRAGHPAGQAADRDRLLDTGRPADHAADVVRFLRARLTEELALLWERDLARPDGWTGPGLAAQVEAVDGVLRLLDSGRLPSPLERRLLLHAYSAHPDYDPAWTTSG